MQRRMWAVLLAVGATAALAAAPVAAAAEQSVTAAGQSVTATGTGQSRVHPTNRHNNASIVSAYDAARHAAIGTALSQAHEYAVDYAKAVGMTLGSVVSVSDAQTNGYYGPGPFFGPFGINQFCGTLRQPVFKKVNGRRRIVRTKKVHRCIVPQFAFVTLTVTYSAS